MVYKTTNCSSDVKPYVNGDVIFLDSQHYWGFNLDMLKKVQVKVLVSLQHKFANKTVNIAVNNGETGLNSGIALK